MEDVRILLENKVNPNIKTANGKCALLFAIENSNLEMIKLLLEYGANPNVNELQMTALHLAKTLDYKKQSIIVSDLLLTHGADINWRPLAAETNTLLIDSVTKYPFDYITFI